MPAELRYEIPFNRFVAAAIDDGLWFAVAFQILARLPESMYEDHLATVGIILLVLVGLWLLYFGFAEWRWGQTVGKKVMGMRVVKQDGSKVGFGSALLRNAVRLIDYLIVGPVLIATTTRRRRLGDMLGGTAVVTERDPTAPAPVKPAQPQEDTPLTEREHVQLTSPVAPPTPPAPARRAGAAGAKGSPYVGLAKRIMALLIDDVLWFFVLVFVAAPLPEHYLDDHSTAAGLLLIVFASLWFNYFPVCEWKWGRTLGKKSMNIEVQAEDGGPVSFSAASIRNVVRLIDFFFFLIGPILIVGSSKRQRLGDKWAHTVVVREGTAAEQAANPAPVGDEPPKPARDGARGVPRVTWSLGQTISGLIAGLFLSVFIAPLFVLPFDHDLSSLGAILTAQALLTVALMGTALYFARRPEPSDLRTALGRLGWRRFKPRSLWLVPATLFAYYVAVAIYVSVVGEPKQEDIGGDLGLDRGFWLASLAVFLICVVAPVAEESFFRGFLYGGLRQRLSELPAAAISGLVFGGVHAPTGPTAIVPLAMLGFALALLYERTGSIWPGVLAHALNNALALAVSG